MTFTTFTASSQLPLVTRGLSSLSQLYLVTRGLSHLTHLPRERCVWGTVPCVMTCQLMRHDVPASVLIGKKISYPL